MKNVYQVISQIMDETALHRLLEDAEGDIQGERFDCYECDVDKDKIHISFTAPSDNDAKVLAYWCNQREWTLVDVFAERVEYLPIKLLELNREPLELF